MQFAHCFAAQPPAAALVGFRGIGESVAEYNAARSQSRFNDFGNVLRARSEHQRHFRKRRQSGSSGIEQHLANLFSSRRSSRFPGFDDLVPGRPKCLGKLAHLRALTRSIQPFKRDELSAARHSAKMIPAWSRCTLAISTAIVSNRLPLDSLTPWQASESP